MTYVPYGTYIYCIKLTILLFYVICINQFSFNCLQLALFGGL